MNNKYFHFTIGPVQGFVAQARRTRDFWSGSFILSWLSAVAIEAVKQQGGKICFPKPNNDFLDALNGRGNKKPKQGSIPNRFKAEVHVKDFDPDKVSKAVQDAWKALADKVWKNDLEAVAKHGNHTKDIWDRQIEHFWDIEWALVPEEDTHDALDRLKNWRTYMPPDEPGVKCMMMDGWQELSGAERPGQQPQAFWEAVREQNKTGIKSDLREGEMLCAIAFVKRRFVRHFEEKYQLSDFAVHGWELPSGVPSVDYLAAAHWLAKLIEKTDQDLILRDKFWDFHDKAYELTGEYGEWKSNIQCVRQAVEKYDGHKKWEALNGEVFFESALENKRLWEPKENEAKELARQLRSLQKAADVKAATPFYAVLLMDGDELGKNLKQHSQEIALGLGEFTGGVEKIVKDNSGFLVYAGGDDVLAILPLEDALPCATALRNYYADCFKDYPAVQTTLSGAIEYGHVKMPLGKILADAHDLLDQIAKEKYGRDSIACRVWKPGDKPLEWAMPWEKALDQTDHGQTIIQQLVSRFQQQEKDRETKSTSQKDTDFQAIANGFFYRIRHYFSLFENGDEKLDETVLDLLAMEYIDSELTTIKSIPKTRKALQPLLDQCQPERRSKNEAGEIEWQPIKPNPDAAMLVRFLAQKGAE